MGITSGDKLGHFEITGLLGKGGMGEVYRAHDTKLEREVAIKVLPDDLANDPERLERFEREAKMLAALDHPNIGALYDFQHVDDVRFLVLQLVEGETLQDRIDRGPMPPSEALPIFTQIAEALEAAHAKHIIHRDLKPGNIQLAPEGIVKVLDFGLARPLDRVRPTTLSPSDPTRQADPNRVTTDGSILGTPSYMSPEQARGKDIDKRSDIWAFGCCLYEALTGRQPFHGATVSDILAKVLEREPDWEALPNGTPWKVREIIERCLEKDPRFRMRDIGDAWSDLKKMTTDSGRMTPEASVTEAPRRRAATLMPIVIAASVMVGAAAAWLGLPLLSTPVEVDPMVMTGETDTKMPAPAPVKRFELNIGPVRQIEFFEVSAEVAISRDGRRVAYVAQMDRRKYIYVRDLATLDTIRLPQTERGTAPFFSPDGQWIGYFAPNESAGDATGMNPQKLVKISVQGGDPIEIGRGLGAGATWLEDGTIVYSGQDGDLNLNISPFLCHLFRVNASGGTPQRLVKADGFTTGEWAYTNPSALPGDLGFLFDINTGPGAKDIGVHRLDTDTHINIIKNARSASYAPSGHILFNRGAALWAVPFDLETFQIRGEEVVVQNDVQSSPQSARTYGISATGALLYTPTLPTRGDRRGLVWVDHQGEETNVKLPLRSYIQARVSPDGNRIATTIGDYDFAKDTDIWLHDVRRKDSLVRLTTERSGRPVWMPDGRHIVYGGFVNGYMNMMVRRADGLGSTEFLHPSDESEVPIATTPSGDAIFFGKTVSATGTDLYELIVGSDITSFLETPIAQRKTRTILETPANEGNPTLSPDGKWIAYTSSKNGAHVFVRPYPDIDATRVQVSTERGGNSRWSPNRNEIYYWVDGKMMAAEIAPGPPFSSQTPRVLFEGDYYVPLGGYPEFDIHPDGDRFLMIKPYREMNERKIVYVENWSQELTSVVPATQTP